MKLSEMGDRGCDAHGCGHYKAPRGARKHNGKDLCNPDDSSLKDNTPIHFDWCGVVVKVGRAYAAQEKAHFKYVAIELVEGLFCRVFYINPAVGVGDIINPCDLLGYSQRLSEGMKDHVHIEFYAVDNGMNIHNKKNFRYIDPDIAFKLIGVGRKSNAKAS